MKKLLFILLLFITFFGNSQKIMSWNLENLGETKFKKDSIMLEIVDVLKLNNPDIIAIQEVVTNKYGDSCIHYIAKKLGYNFIISKPTTGDGTERYAYIYKSSVLMNYNYLDSTLQDSIDREPYVASFKYNNKNIILRTVHLVPNTKIPQKEIAQLYKYKDGIICGDFNLTDEHLIFIPLLKLFESPIYGKPTTLKKNGDLSKNSYDHFLVSKKIKFKYGVLMEYNYKYNRNLISDHLPIMLVIN